MERRLVSLAVTTMRTGSKGYIMRSGIIYSGSDMDTSTTVNHQHKRTDVFKGHLKVIFTRSKRRKIRGEREEAKEKNISELVG